MPDRKHDRLTPRWRLRLCDWPRRLNEKTIDRLIDFVDRNVRRDGCNRTHRFTSQWSQEHNITWDDLLDALEQRGAFCDCEVVLNL